MFLGFLNKMESIYNWLKLKIFFFNVEKHKVAQNIPVTIEENVIGFLGLIIVTTLFSRYKKFTNYNYLFVGIKKLNTDPYICIYKI